MSEYIQRPTLSKGITVKAGETQHHTANQMKTER